MLFAGEILTQTQHVHNDMAENDRYFTISIFHDMPGSKLLEKVAAKNTIFKIVLNDI